MKKFIVLYHANESAKAEMGKGTPEEQKKGMEPWMAWKEKIGDSLIDLGAPLGMAKNVTSSGNIDSNSSIVGYSILQAESMNEALDLLKDHPHTGWNEGCSIEVHESMPMPGQ